MAAVLPQGAECLRVGAEVASDRLLAVLMEEATESRRALCMASRRAATSTPSLTM